MKLFKNISLILVAILMAGLVQANDNERVTYDQAVEICKAQGKRLPTIRELAVEATKYGAKIRESSAGMSDKEHMSYTLIEAIDDHGNRDYFLYLGHYKAGMPWPPEHKWVWTSSYRDRTNYTGKYCIDQYNGEANSYYYGDDDYAYVQCVK